VVVIDGLPIRGATNFPEEKEKRRERAREREKKETERQRGDVKNRFSSPFFFSTSSFRA
jgi:hypothetical protein